MAGPLPEVAGSVVVRRSCLVAELFKYRGHAEGHVDGGADRGGRFELPDSEGLDGLGGLNMRAPAQRLGTAATAIYWHIRIKDELVQLAGDAIWPEIELPDLEGGDWRAAAMTVAGGLHGMLTRHPWLGQAFGSHLLAGPGRFRYDDQSLAIYEQAGPAPPRGPCCRYGPHLRDRQRAGHRRGGVTQPPPEPRWPDPEQTIQALMISAQELASQVPRLESASTPRPQSRLRRRIRQRALTRMSGVVVSL